MTAPNEGKCVCKDGLSETLDKIRNADALIIGSPLYFGDLTAGFRALYERLMFQYLTYNAEKPCCNERKLPVLLLTSGNCTKDRIDVFGITGTLEKYRHLISEFIGPATVLYAEDTLQVEDYSKYNWTVFDPNAKLKSREEKFPVDLKEAFEAGKNLI